MCKSLLVLLCSAAVLSTVAARAQPLECMKRCNFQDFVISAWWGLDPTEENYRKIAEAGFNVVLTYRDRYDSDFDRNLDATQEHPAGEGQPEAPAERHSGGRLPLREMELAQKYGLSLMIDGFSFGAFSYQAWEPWISIEAGRSHHDALADKIAWFHEHYGDNPTIMGYLLNDNTGGIHDNDLRAARYLQQAAPGLIAWNSDNPDPSRQSTVRDVLPALSSQNYAFLYLVNQPETEKRRAYLDGMEGDRRLANAYGFALWPIFSVDGGVNASQLRYQAYGAVAYGAQGIWYFTQGCLSGDCSLTILSCMQWRPGSDELWEPAAETNRYLRDHVGPRVIGQRCVGVYHTPGPEIPQAALTPAEGRLVQSMSRGLLAGVLVREPEFFRGEAAARYLMVVDKRTVPYGEPEPGPRRVWVQLGPSVEQVTVITPQGPERRELSASGAFSLELRAGEGRLVQLD